ncbi:hypothetical protein ACWDA3_53450 [Nonomuraea rubra]
MEQIGNWGFWLGLLLALPIGIVTNLLTPRVQARWATRSRRMASKREQDLREQTELVARYRQDQAAYWSYLYLSLTRLLFRVAMLLAAVLVPFLTTEFLWGLGGLMVLIFNAFVLVISVGIFAAILNERRRTRGVVAGVAMEAFRDEEAGARPEPHQPDERD